MIGRGLVTLVVGACVLTMAPSAAAAPAAPATVDRVLIISVPRLTWKDVADQRPPALLSLFRRSAVASMSLRTVSSRTTLGEGYATIGAGNRASVDELTAGLAFDANERFENSTAAAVYQRRTGRPPTGGVLDLGLAPSLRRNERLLYGTRLGALGSALENHHRRAGVIGERG